MLCDFHIHTKFSDGVLPLTDVVGLKKFNYIANSDFHEPRHLYSWKTLLRCEKNAEAIKAAIRTNHGVSIYLLRPGKQPQP